MNQTERKQIARTLIADTAGAIVKQAAKEAVICASKMLLAVSKQDMLLADYYKIRAGASGVIAVQSQIIKKQALLPVEEKARIERIQ